MTITWGLIIEKKKKRRITRGLTTKTNLFEHGIDATFKHLLYLDGIDATFKHLLYLDNDLHKVNDM